MLFNQYRNRKLIYLTKVQKRNSSLFPTWWNTTNLFQNRRKQGLPVRREERRFDLLWFWWRPFLSAVSSCYCSKRRRVDNPANLQPSQNRELKKQLYFHHRQSCIRVSVESAWRKESGNYYWEKNFESEFNK